MKQFRQLFSVLIMLITLSVGNVWAAEDVAYTLTPAAGSNNNYASACDVTINGIVWNVTGNSTLTPWRLGGKSLSGVDRAVYSKTAISDDISKIVVTHGAASSITINSMTVVVASDANFNTVVSTLTPTFVANNSVTITRPSGKSWANCYYKFIYNVTVSGTSNKFLAFSGAEFYKEVSTATCATPTFSPAGGTTFYGESQEVEISCSTADATIHYTTNGSTPTASSATYSSPLTLTGTTTVKAIAVKTGCVDSEVATATYTKGNAVTSYNIDFEENVLEAYANWEFTNIAIATTTISAHGGTYYANTNGKATASITTKTKITSPGTLTFYISKESSNTTASSWKAQVSSDGSEWSDVGEEFSATSMSKGVWNECVRDLSEYNNVYVRIYYGSNTAIRTIDDISLEMASSIAKPSITGDDNFLTSTTVSLACSTDGATIYYTTNGSDPKTAGSVYSDPFSLTAGATVKAAAKVGNDWSSVAEKTFTKITPMTVADARSAIDAGGDLSNKYVAGTISQIDSYNSTYNSITYWISDDGTTTNQLQVYSGLAGVAKGGAAFSSVEDLMVGDDVTVNGTLKKYNSTYEFDYNNTIVVYKPVARLAWSETSYEADLNGENTFPTLTNTNNVTVTYSSSNTSIAEISSSTGEITLKAEGQTTITASFAGNGTYKANSVSYTLTVADNVVRGTITYNTNEGTNVDAMADQTALPDPLPTTTKEGKNFGGWYTDEGLNTKAVAGAAITGDITLYAKWLDPYTVAEAKAIIDESGSIAGQYVTGIISQIDSYSSQYKSITYWISADGTTDNQLEVYSGKGLNNADFSAVTDLVLGDTVVVYGTLKKYNSTYEFDKNNYLISMVRPEVAVRALQSIELSGNYPTKFTVGDAFSHQGLVVTAHYTIGEDANVTAQAVVSEPAMNMRGNKTVTVSYTEEDITKTATYSVSVTSDVVLNKEPVAVVATYGGKHYAMSTTIESKTAQAVEVTFNNEGAVEVADEDAKAAITWYMSDVTDGITLQDASDKYLTGAAGNTGLSLAASECIWVADKNGYYSIGGTTGTTRTILYADGTGFKNYSTQNISGNGYSGVVEFVPVVIAAPAPATYTVTFAPNGGTFTTETVTSDEEGKVILPADKPVRDGYYFMGWKDAGNNMHQAGAELTVSADITLTAQWEELAMYERTVTAGNFGTICLANPVYEGCMENAEVYKVVSRTEDNLGIILEQVTAMEAGMPYLFIGKTATVRFYHSVEHASAALDYHGLHGTIEGLFGDDAIEGAGYFVLQNNLLRETTSGAIAIGTNRAYLVISEVPAYGAADPSQAAGVRCRVIGMEQGSNTATGCDELPGSEAQVTKVLRNGVLYIICADRTYNAQGQLVK